MKYIKKSCSFLSSMAPLTDLFYLFCFIIHPYFKFNSITNWTIPPPTTTTAATKSKSESLNQAFNRIHCCCYLNWNYYLLSIYSIIPLLSNGENVYFFPRKRKKYHPHPFYSSIIIYGDIFLFAFIYAYGWFTEFPELKFLDYDDDDDEQNN